jgi:hypothetical protein
MLDMNKEADGPIATALSYDIEELEFEANSLDIEQKDRNNLFSLGMIFGSTKWETLIPSEPPFT